MSRELDKEIANCPACRNPKRRVHILQRKNSMSRTIGYYRSYEDQPGQPISVIPNTMWDYSDMTAPPKIQFDITVGDTYTTLSPDEMVTLISVLSQALEDSDRVVSDALYELGEEVLEEVTA